MTVRKVISGGQTGADRGGLEAAEALGLGTGGKMPQGFRTEEGPRPEIAERFNLKQHPSTEYEPRTRHNVRDSDATVVFGDSTTSGSRLTVAYCKIFEKPHLVNPTYRELRAWLEKHETEVLNVAGNPESKNPGLRERVRAVIITAVRQNSFA